MSLVSQQSLEQDDSESSSPLDPLELDPEFSDSDPLSLESESLSESSSSFCLDDDFWPDSFALTLLSPPPGSPGSGPVLALDAVEVCDGRDVGNGGNVGHVAVVAFDPDADELVELKSAAQFSGMVRKGSGDRWKMQNNQFEDLFLLEFLC